MDTVEREQSSRAARAPFVVANAVLGGMAAFVAWGRGRKAPVAPRASP